MKMYIATPTATRAALMPIKAVLLSTILLKKPIDKIINYEISHNYNIVKDKQNLSKIQKISHHYKQCCFNIIFCNMDMYRMQSKTVYVENDETKQSEIFTIQMHRFDEFVDFSPIIENIPEWATKVFQIYNPNQDSYISLDSICQDKFMVPKENLMLNVVMIKYFEEPEKPESDPQSEENKKERSRQRNIREVIQMVHKWRDLHQTGVDGKKINLQEAAKIVGISKKSLDDYFFQLRMGEKYGFDFLSNMNSKVGLLRSFVKQKQFQYKKNGRDLTRHPKKLKIIQEFAEKLNLKDKNETKTQNQPSKASQGNQKQKQQFQNPVFNLVDSSQLFWGSPFSPIEEKAILDCQNIFFKDFQNIMQQPNDPFIPFTGFKKTKSIFGDDFCNSNSSEQIPF